MSPEDRELNEQWCLGHLAKHTIDSEAIPLIMEIHNNKRLQEGSGLTIRLVLWINRLYKLVKNPDNLYECALFYTANQRYSEFIGTQQDTTGLDIKIFNRLHQDGSSEKYWGDDFFFSGKTKRDDNSVKNNNTD